MDTSSSSAPPRGPDVREPDPWGLTCAGVGVTFHSRGRDVVAIDDVTFSAAGGDIVGIVGPSGCGKSTLLRTIAGLMIPTTGAIELGREVASAPCPTALVFQEHAVFPWMSVLENVAFGLEMRGIGAAESRRRAVPMIERVGLTRFAGSYPHELSVGMRQRAGIARAFLSDAPVLLMDEPFGALDAQTKRVLQDELLDLLEDQPKLVVFVTHDISEAVHLSDRVLVMSRRPGRIKDDVPIPQPQPRPRGYAGGALASGLIERIWHRLEHDVRRELEMSG